MLRLSLYAILFCFVFSILHQPKESRNASQNIFNPNNGNAGRVLLLTAHPDDECMFFAPTISALVGKIHEEEGVSNALHSEVARRNTTALYSLCLSIGDADSLGHIRREELGRSLDVIGIAKSNRWVLDHMYVIISYLLTKLCTILISPTSDLKDNMTSNWSPKIIAEVLMPYIIEHQISTVCIHIFCSYIPHTTQLQ
jgi:N-acetylglucosaminylphosphatidylinositol deacetylase